MNGLESPGYHNRMQELQNIDSWIKEFNSGLGHQVLDRLVRAVEEDLKVGRVNMFRARCRQTTSQCKMRAKVGSICSEIFKGELERKGPLGPSSGISERFVLKPDIV